MRKTELANRLAELDQNITIKDAQGMVNTIISQMVDTLAKDERIEIRGFGSFSLHHLPARMGRNPKTGEALRLPAKRMPHFKPGKELKEAVINSANNKH